MISCVVFRKGSNFISVKLNQPRILIKTQISHTLALPNYLCWWLFARLTMMAKMNTGVMTSHEVQRYWCIIAPTNELAARPHAQLLSPHPPAIYCSDPPLTAGWLLLLRIHVLYIQLVAVVFPAADLAPNFSSINLLRGGALHPPPPLFPQHVITQSCWHTWEYDPHINHYHCVLSEEIHLMTKV